MDVHVSLKITQMREVFITNLAFKRFFTSMHVHMYFKVIGSVKMFVTDSALMVLYYLLL